MRSIFYNFSIYTPLGEHILNGPITGILRRLKVAEICSDEALLTFRKKFTSLGTVTFECFCFVFYSGFGKTCVLLKNLAGRFYPKT
jgi:hypothetical protein